MIGTYDPDLDQRNRFDDEDEDADHPLAKAFPDGVPGHPVAQPGQPCGFGQRPNPMSAFDGIKLPYGVREVLEDQSKK